MPHTYTQDAIIENEDGSREYAIIARHPHKDRWVYAERFAIGGNDCQIIAWDTCQVSLMIGLDPDFPDCMLDAIVTRENWEDFKAKMDKAFEMAGQPLAPAGTVTVEVLRVVELDEASEAAEVVANVS